MPKLLDDQLKGSLALIDHPKEIEVVAQHAVTPMSILQMAMTQNAGIDQLTKLMELQERWEANEARKAFNAAMARFKANPPDIRKNKHVKFGNTEYSHATLDHVTDQITSALSAVGLSHKWDVLQTDKEISVSCVLTHELGHSERTTLRSGADTSGSKNAIQAIGSAVTYLQRYTLLAATGMAAGTDNDGAATGKAALDDDNFQRMCGLIENADTKQKLQAEYFKAIGAAQLAGDEAAQRKFIALKDTRYKELS
jgi:hypothetical protein